MFQETKEMVEKALNIGRILFSLPIDDYNKLLNAITNIPPYQPRDDETNINYESIYNYYIKQCSDIALSMGLKEKHGIAMFQYSLLVESLRDGKTK